MSAYNVVNRTALATGQIEDISVVLANFDAIAAVINGALDGTNISSSAVVTMSSLTLTSSSSAVLALTGALGGVTFGGDTVLSRTGAAELTLVGSFIPVNVRATQDLRANSGTANQIWIGHTGGSLAPRIVFGDDLGVTLYRSTDDTLKSDDGFWAVGGLVTKTKAGIPTDADLVVGMRQSGAFIVDETNSRIYFRVGTTWKFAALT